MTRMNKTMKEIIQTMDINIESPPNTLAFLTGNDLDLPTIVASCGACNTVVYMIISITSIEIK